MMMGEQSDRVEGFMRVFGARINRRNDGGAQAWCKKCSRTHGRRTTCNLYLRDRIAKSGETVKRWAH
jgi:hypothetical protein